MKGKKGDGEVDSQYSGHSSSSLRKDGGPAPANTGPPRTRLNNGARVKRNGSTATTASSSRVTGRRKMPSSVTSSLNSSESEHGSVPHSAASRATNASNKSVYLHATAVADIPTMTKNGAPPGQEQSNLKNSKKISRSISLLTPFKSKKNTAQADKEVNYDSTGNQMQAGKPPRPPPQTRRIQPTMTKEKKFASSSDLLRDDTAHSGPENGRVSHGNGNGVKHEDPKSSKVSRSVSMPKDTRLAGWFKKRKKV